MSTDESQAKRSWLAISELAILCLLPHLVAGAMTLAGLTFRVGNSYPMVFGPIASAGDRNVSNLMAAGHATLANYFGFLRLSGYYISILIIIANAVLFRMMRYGELFAIVMKRRKGPAYARKLSVFMAVMSCFGIYWLYFSDHTLPVGQDGQLGLDVLSGGWFLYWTIVSVMVVLIFAALPAFGRYFVEDSDAG